MILNKYKSILSLLFASFFCVLFYQKNLGLNVLLYEAFILPIMYLIYKPKLITTLSRLVFVGTVISCLMVVIHNSSIAKTANILSFLLLIGVFTYSDFKLLKNIFSQFTTNLTSAYKAYFSELSTNKNRKSRVFHYLKVIIIPLLIIGVFLTIYYNSNEYFASLTDSFFAKLNNLFSWFNYLNFSLFFVFIVGLTLAISSFYGKKNNLLIVNESKLTDGLFRRRNERKNFPILGLKNEIKSGVFLLFVLNFMLVIFNYSDIKTVWFSYEWNGGFLKEFVHNGTYLLIISLLLSISIVLYYFRGNINFYKKHNLLKTLTYIWLAQNILLIISLTIRNNIYIEHFALAYKRIGVYVFLIAALYGIYTIIIKVKSKKSYYYLVRHNTLLIYGLFIVLTCVNWDVFIAKYNLKLYEKSFIEMEYLLQLSDKSLPYINVKETDLNEIYNTQNQLFSFKKRYISQINYSDHLQHRINAFIEKYPKRSFLEWNYADYVAYGKLKK